MRPTAQLFPITDNAARVAICRLGIAVLGKRVYPHLLRHSSATYWSNRLGYFKLCKRFGWTMTSAMPQRYIDREGVDELEMAQAHLQSDQARSERDTRLLRAELAETTLLLSESHAAGALGSRRTRRS